MRSDWLDAFLVFSKSMNFTRAAEELHISQPALHVKIKQLSAALDRPLYRKVGRNLILTEAGEKTAAHALDQRQRALAFEEAMRTGMGRSPTVLCAGSGAFLYLLGPAISRFTSRADETLNLMTGDRDRTIAAVASGQAHLGVTALDEPPKGLVATLLTRVDQMLVVPKDHRLAGLKTVTLEDLRDEELIVPPADRPHRILLNRMLMDVGVRWRVAVEANGWELMMHFVALGMGLAIVNGSCRIPQGLVGRPMKELPGVRYHMVERPEAGPHPGTEILKSLLVETSDAWRANR